MKLAAAQIKAKEQDTEATIQAHLSMIELAAQQRVDLILFPEMSLTGYEREKAAALAFTEKDTRLAVFVEKAIYHQILICVGAPIKINSELYIGSFIFSPDGSITIYTKQFLHDGEELYFSSSKSFNPILEYKNQKISFAICADITHLDHARQACDLGTTLYLASIFYTPNGLSQAYNQLGTYAKRFSMNILMANYTGSSYQLEAAGKSAFWNKDGSLVRHLNAMEEGLLVIDL